MEQLETLYLDWFNNFLTLERFAEYYTLTIAEATDIIRFCSSNLG